MAEGTEHRYAIVGMGGIFPDAPDLSAYWQNILSKRVSITHLPEDSIERKVFFRPEVLRKQNKGDKSYTDLQARIAALDFDPELFRIPPSTAKHMDENQKVVLLATQQAMAGHALDSVAKERVGVVIGNSGYGILHHEFHRRFMFERFAHHLECEPSVDPFIPVEKRKALIEVLRDKALEGTFGLSEDSAPGILPSIIAGRISSVFDFHGQSMILDTACASGLAAISCALQQLRLHQNDAVICGAVDMPIHEAGRLYFSAIGALSPDGSFPFDARANGFVIGQGGGIIILKRLQDAIETGDDILAVIAAVGVSTDGKGKAIAAPNEVWQAQAVRNAYQTAGYPVDTVELVEAHGTSTQVGDKSEVNALKRAFAAMGCGRKDFCGIGSVKSNIGHLKSAAGIAGLLKATLALHHKWLPPTASFERLSPAINLADSPFYVLAEGKAWAESATPRRAGVSSFGFGGVNYHVALEEYRPGDHRPRISVPGKSSPGPSKEIVASVSNVALFAGATIEELLAQVSEVRQQVERADVEVNDLLATLNGRTHRSRAQRLGFTVSSREDFLAKLELVRSCEATVEALGQLSSRGIHFSALAPVSASEVAVLFPGQGSQYPGMLGFVRRHFQTAQTLETRANRLWQELTQTTVSALLDPGDEGAEARLRDTVNTHPTILTVSLAAYAVLEQMGLRPACVLGHSLGEYAALVAAGRLSLAEGLKLMRARGQALGTASAGDGGSMLALPLDESTTAALIAESKLPVCIANRNSPRQTIVAGGRDAVDNFRSFATGKGHRAVVLNVSRAFHSPLMQEAERVFEAELRQTDFRPSRTPVLSAVDAQILGDSREAVCATLAKQITSPVDFIAGIERLYADGIRVFVEVGPSSVLSGLTKEILGQRPGLVLSSDGRKPDSDEAFLRLLCALHVAGLPIDPSAVATTACQPSAPALRASEKPAPVLPAAHPGRERVVYSGVSVGLPGSYKDAFRDDNFEQLFEGRNFIERLTDPERQALLDLHISKVVKSEQGASIVELQTLGEVIQLAGKLGRLDLAAHYQVDDKELQTMSTCVAHAVAAGYEALRDAQIPLVLEYTRTSSGRLLPDRWALPREMQASTGIIFANGFPLIDPVIAEVSRHLSLTLGRRTREALYEFYDGLIAKITHAESRKLLADWFALHYGRLSAVPSQEQVYRFNHQLMTQISLQANNRLAKRLNARGPNFQLNAACSSAATAIMLAEEMIQAGRVERMIVIGADDPTSTHSLPYLGAGFLSTGACSNRGDLYEAALPFDKRRDGMIMGSGAMAIVIEAESQCVRRGVSPVCELLGTHVFNAASHGSQLDVARYAEELEVFMARMERRHGLNRSVLAPQLVYFSHEPYTPARGGCSESEAAALRHVFGNQVGEVEVSNTKGMTGHTMGASIEDVTAAKALQFGRVPPVVNHKVPDPSLAGLKLSKGGSRDFQYALRMAAGFGSQGNYVLLRRIAAGDKRITDPASHQSWLRTISGQDAPELGELGRMLVIKDSQPGAVMSERPRIDRAPCQSAVAKPTQAKLATPAPTEQPAAKQSSAEQEQVRERVLEIVSSITGYKRSLLDLDMELEADLGVDTVKQATILATLAETFGISGLENVHLSDYPSLRGLIGLMVSKSGAAPAPAVPVASGTALSPSDEPSSGPSSAVQDVEAVTTVVREIVADVTGYRLALVEPSMELEADLGVDTVKQATILAKLAEHFGIGDEPDSFRISAFPTVGHLAAHFAKAVGPQAPATAPVTSAPPPPQAVAAPAEPKPVPASRQATPPAGDIQSRLVRLLAECTPYPAEMLEPDLTLDSDLGLDAGVRERFRQACVAAFDLGEDWSLPINARIADLPALLSVAPKPASASTEQGGSLKMARQILGLRSAALATESEPLAEKLVWIWGDDTTCVRGLRNRLQGQAREVRTLVFPASGDPDEALQAAKRELGRAAPDILIDASVCGTEATFASAEPEAFASTLSRAADARFAVWKHMVAKKLRPGRTVLVTMIDGAHGLAGLGQVTNPLFGLHAGFYKSLRKLGPDHVVILDMAPSTDTSAWAPLMTELSSRGPGVEICYQDGVRKRVALIDSEAPQPDASRSLGKDEVVVVTGGGSGITAAIIRHLATRAPRHVAIVGRTALGPDTRRFHALAPTDREKEKDAIRERLIHAGQKATPVLVDKAYAALERAAEIHDTLAAIEAAGAHVTYHEADVCDGARMASVLGEIRRVHGPITTLIHGAGIEISRTIEKKPLAEFQSVLRTKVLGAFNLSRLCRQDPLRRVVAISSIAGRLGSPAQIDYAAANGFLDVWARSYQHQGVRGLSLIWSAWAEQGMAWRNSFVRENAERSGLGFIDPAAGARAAVDEMLADSSDVEVVLHRGLGDVLDPELAEVDPQPYPFLDWTERAADRVALWRRFSPKRDAMLDQHRLGKTSLMPGVGLMEMMAESHALLTGTREGALVYRQLEFSDALKFYRDTGRDVQVRVEGSRMEVWSPFRSPQGDIVEDRLYARALVNREAVKPPQDSPALWDLGRTIDRVSVARTFEDAAKLRQGMNLGPLLNESSRPGHDPAANQVVLGEQGILTRVRLPKAQLSEPRYPFARFHVNPAFLDSLHQAAAIYCVMRTGAIHLPVGAQEFTIFTTPNLDANYDVIARVCERAGDRVWFDVAMLHEGRQLFCLARRVELRRTGQ